MPAFRGRIVVIGWGSLIWDLDDLAPHVEGEWRMRAGPELPFEFSRISPKRKRALVVCIDPAAGRNCPTNVILSRRSDIHEAAEDLRRRERAPAVALIGACCLRSGFLRSRTKEAASAVLSWVEAAGASGAVWTDLDANFASETGAPFSLDAAIAYLRSLEGESLEEARRYIANAPEATDTPLRRTLAAESWWRG